MQYEIMIRAWQTGGASMGELLDRTFQAEILNTLATAYPNEMEIYRKYGEIGSKLFVNVKYLEEHGLLTAKWRPYDGQKLPLRAAVTAKGLDFLADDGGLGAILGVLTVKLHDDTIRQLLISRIEQASGDATVKEGLIRKVKELPAEALGTVVTSGLSKALEGIPNVLGFLNNLLPK